MQHEERTEVLVVGAGPVGMLSALLLARAGVRVRIIDQECRTASRTYACALHSRTLQLLHKLGLAEACVAAGRRVEKVGFYEGASRQAEIDLRKVRTDDPYVVVLPQSAFENLLEERLHTEARVQVAWNHQLSGLRTEGGTAVATVDKLGVSAKGYIIPEMEWAVEKTETVRASYVVGADGPNSFLAQSLRTEYDMAGEPEFFAVYEFESDWSLGNELRIVLDPGTTSVLWPLPGGKYRWSFQLRQEHLPEFPSKERSSVVIDQPALDEANRRFILKLIQERAPWFQGAVRQLGWSTDVEFAHKVARRFGQDHCWLVGDAAHQTGPGGMQSMNLGLLEAERLAGALVQVLRGKASAEAFETYQRECRDAWQPLLGLSAPPQTSPRTENWVRERAARILSCVPASGEELKALLAQIELRL